MTNELLTFERDLYRAVIRFKQDHPGVLEARTKERKQHETIQNDLLSLRPDDPDD